MNAVTESKRSSSLVLFTASLVSSLVMLDSNLVAVSLPAIGRSFHSSFTDLEWVINAYFLSYASLLLASGAYADLRGRRRAMVVGLAVFGLASAACGGAQSSLMLNLARALQGVGGSLLLTSGVAVLTNTFTGVERTRAFAVWGTTLGIALMAGPIVGGLITNTVGWRWAFFVNVPLCVALVVATRTWIPESRDPAAKRLDRAGIMLFSPGLLLVVWGLTDGNDAGWTSPTIVARIAGGIGFLVVFVLVERRQTEPLLDLGLFKDSRFVGAVLAMAAYGATAQIMVFFLPLVLQNAYGFGPARSGIAMIPFALPMVLAPRLVATLARRVPMHTTLRVGLIVTSLGDLAFWAVARGHHGYAFFAMAMVVAGIGAGALNGETVKAISAAVPVDRAGQASGIASTTRFVAIMIGVSGLGAVIQATGAADFALGFANASFVAAGVAFATSIAVASILRRGRGSEAVLG